jgi:pantothenate kinase
MIEVSPSGEELGSLLEDRAGARAVIGISGSPGAGKSTLARHLADRLGQRGAHVPMDGFHLADVELRRQRLLDRKGAPETFDPHGYAALLARLRREGREVRDTVYAPGFDRDLEQPVAGAIAVPPEAEVIVTEGNYLLLDRPEWRNVRRRLDVVWHVCVTEDLRLDRLVARHVESGKSLEQARAWVERVDGPNSRLVEASAHRADVVIGLTHWHVGGARSVVPPQAP